MSIKAIRGGRLFVTLVAMVCMACMAGLLAPAAIAPVAIAQGVFVQTAFAAAGSEEVVLTVKQSFASDGTPPSKTFDYRLTPIEHGCPMPPGSGADGFAFAVTGTDRANIRLAAFSQAGVYTYELCHTTGMRPGYIYDQEVYTLEILVNSDMTTAVVASKMDGCKAEDISYSHAYISFQEPPPANPDPPGPGNPAGPGPANTYAAGGKPKTGDEFPAGLYTALICLAGAAMLGSAGFLLARGRRRRQGGQ